jgi:hypothetical protein
MVSFYGVQLLTNKVHMIGEYGYRDFSINTLFKLFEYGCFYL